MSERQNTASQKILVIISTLMMCTISFSLSAPSLLTDDSIVEAGSSGVGSRNVTSSIPNPCIGNGTNTSGNIVSDVLEVNDAQSTASPASILPVSCTDLSLHSSTDIDYFEIHLVTGVTYYVNVTFSHAIHDVDVGWDTINGSFLASGS